MDQTFHAVLELNLLNPDIFRFFSIRQCILTYIFILIILSRNINYSLSHWKDSLWRFDWPQKCRNMETMGSVWKWYVIKLYQFIVQKCSSIFLLISLFYFYLINWFESTRYAKSHGFGKANFFVCLAYFNQSWVSCFAYMNILGYCFSPCRPKWGYYGHYYY